jgi:hypothetical protein
LFENGICFRSVDDDYAGNLHRRHPRDERGAFAREVRAVLGEPRRMSFSVALAAILRGSQELAPQDDVRNRSTDSEERALAAPHREVPGDAA